VPNHGMRHHVSILLHGCRRLCSHDLRLDYITALVSFTCVPLLPLTAFIVIKIAFKREILIYGYHGRLI
jgi:hypothetical protein